MSKKKKNTAMLPQAQQDVLKSRVEPEPEISDEMKVMLQNTKAIEDNIELKRCVKNLKHLLMNVVKIHINPDIKQLFDKCDELTK